MSAKYLIIDLETIPERSLWAPKPLIAGEEEEFPPPSACRIVCFGAMALDEDYNFVKLGSIGSASDEKSMLEIFADWVNSVRPILVTWNGRRFDVPVINMRSMRLGVSQSWYYQKFQGNDFRYRYNEHGHLDLLDQIQDFGTFRGTHLDLMARSIGLPGKLGMDGSQVEQLFHEGRFKEIEEYCLTDVTQTGFLLLRWKLLTGQIPIGQYRTAAYSVWQAIQERQQELVSKTNVELLLLANGI